MTTPTQPSAEAIAAAEKLRLVGLPRYEPVLEAASIIDAHFAEVRSAAVTVLKGFDEGVFIRDIFKDREPGWAVKLLPYIIALGKLKKFTEPTPPSDGRGKQ